MTTMEGFKIPNRVKEISDRIRAARMATGTTGPAVPVG
jgi:hypothetical protein